MADLLSEKEFHRIHMLSQGEYDALSNDVKEAYARAKEHHFDRRMDDLDVSSIQTGDGKTFQEKLEEYRPPD